MKILFLMLIFLLVFDCSNQVTDNGDLNHSIIFFSDKLSYSQTETIYVTLKNNSYGDLIIGLRCGSLLEMYFQKMEYDQWSANYPFKYMFLRCPTFVDSLKTGESFIQPLEAELFESSGSFRLITNDSIISNVFEIKSHGYDQ